MKVIAFLFDWMPGVPDFKTFLLLEVITLCLAAWWILYNVKVSKGN